jgi:hypothetical protein
MKSIVLIIFCLSLPLPMHAKEAINLVNGKKFELSLYGNMYTIGNSIIAQCDIECGVNFFRYLNTSLAFNLQYRNYMLLTNDFFSISGGIVFNKNEFRTGFVGGLYTVRYSGYRKVFPSGGVELIYVFNILEGVSVRLKERILLYSENHNSTIATSTLLGFCIAFIKH